MMDLDFIGACMKGDIEMVNDLLKAGANPNQSDKFEDTPLNKVVRIGDLEMVKLLLKSGADPNKRNKWNNTPLHYAIDKRHLDIIKLLLKAGADPNKANDLGNTPLHWADRSELIELLKSYENKISSLSLLCLRTIYKNQINTDNIPSMILEWNFHQ